MTETLQSRRGPRGPEESESPADGNGRTAARSQGAVGSLIDQLREILKELDPDRFTGTDACKLFQQLSTVGRLVDTGKSLLSPRIEASGVWKDEGESSCASFLASLEGVSRGQARSTLEVGRALAELPICEKAARKGDLSKAKLVELTDTLITDPRAEKSLVAGAETEPLWSVKERCQQVRATSRQRDPLAATRRVHAGRHLTWWSDAEGAFCFQGRDTADRGALMRAELEQVAGELRRTRSSVQTDGTKRDTDGALRIDAFFEILAGRASARARRQRGNGRGSAHDPSDPAGQRPSTGGDTDQVVTRPPRCDVLVRVDLSALLRGHARPNECCEIDGHGPIPVPMARDLANDSFLRVVFHQAGDIRAVSSLGRTVKRSLRAALVARDRCCVVPGCGVTSGLEIDHVVAFAEGGPTELDNLALLCHHHHFLKTFEGWSLKRVTHDPRGQSTWSFNPPRRLGQTERRSGPARGRAP